MTRTYSNKPLQSALILLCLTCVVRAQQVSLLVTLPNPATMVLRSPMTVKHLALTEKQVSAVDPLLDRVEMQLWKLRHAPSAQRSQRAPGLITEFKHELSSALTPFQRQRYQQILWQAQGASALLDPALALQLGLTSDQQQRITAVLSTLQSTLSRLSPGQPALIKQARNAAEQDCYAQLNVLQREQLRRLLGLPVDFSRVVQRAFKAPEFTGVNAWINSPGLTMSKLRGKVTIVHFYTYGCINCVRNLPHYNDWFKRFSDRQVQVVGIHRPETSGEYEIDRVKKKAVEAGIQYPVAVDNDADNWNAWANQVWPSVYLIDKQGFVRAWWYGELNWQGTPGENLMRQRVEALLKE